MRVFLLLLIAGAQLTFPSLILNCFCAGILFKQGFVLIKKERKGEGRRKTGRGRKRGREVSISCSELSS